MQAAVSERLRLIGISIPQCDVLTTLSEEEGVSQQELAKRLYVTKGNISGLLDRLQSAGLVERRQRCLRSATAFDPPDRGRPGDGDEGARRPAPLGRLDLGPDERGRPQGIGNAADCVARHRSRGATAAERRRRAVVNQRPVVFEVN